MNRPETHRTSSSTPRLYEERQSERGVTLVLVAILIFFLVAIVALVIDLSHLYVVKNELQNAADAGAMAAGAVLYSDDGLAINTGCNDVGGNTVLAHTSDKEQVEAYWDGQANSGDVQRGHWSFSTGTFTPNPSTQVYDLWGVSELDLDTDTGFINAVRVIARRQNTPATAFFAGLFGFDSFELEAQAVAYIGFAGPLDASDIDMPIAICAGSLRDATGAYAGCNIGRMINSGNDPASSNTAGWTDFNQDDNPCSGTDANTMKSMVNCTDGVVSSPQELRTEPIAATGGAQQVTYDRVRDCWLEHLTTNGDVAWPMMLPVVECEGHNVGNCPVLVGAVEVEMLWMTEAGTAKPEDAPTVMEDWSWDTFNGPGQECEDLAGQIGQLSAADSQWAPAVYTEGMARWDCFVRHFELENADDNAAPLDKKSMYFRPTCETTTPNGGTGGQNFGVLARYPVLVQ